MNLLKSFIKNKNLIVFLSKNDMKKKYAGSYLGVIWAFVQPIVITLIYWFVFEVGLKTPPSGNYPYVLQLICGLVPWFFFSDALSSTTNCFIEYSYLVKKVVFDIEILPIVKIISSSFVHFFFIALVLFVMAIYGFYPNVFFLQLLYYTVCLFLLIIALSYITATLNVFFNDLSQIVGVLLQVGMWLTPILWSFDMVADFPFAFLLKLNPMFYIVQGYRSTLLDGRWFFESPQLTIYFWCLTIVLLVVGLRLFKKLRPHFSDSL